MAAATAPSGPLSLLGTTIRRAATLGRTNLIVGVVISLLIAVPLSFTNSAGLGSELPIFLPLFAVVGSLGGLLVFTNDRVKGVLEYLIAYGVSPRRIFVNVLLASFVLASIVLVAASSISLGIFFSGGNTLSNDLIEFLALYSLPMSFATVAFAVMVGMYWTALSSPRSGMNSPIGLIPLVGVAPPVLTIAAITVVASTSDFPVFVITSIAVVIVVAIVLILLGLLGRLLPHERLLSPA